MTAGGEMVTSQDGRRPHHRVKLSQLRRRSGEQMARSKAEIPHASITVEADFGAVESAIDEIGPRWRTEHDRSLTPLPFVLAAVVSTLRRFPQANSMLDGNELVVFDTINLGIAVDVPGRGLIVPVIQEAHTMSVGDLALAIGDLADRARSKSLRPDDVTGGTYTVTNIGSLGAYDSSPIVNHPQVAILAVNAITHRPVACTTAEQHQRDHRIVIRPIGLLTQAFDHRAFDGAYCAALLRDLGNTIADTDWERSFSVAPSAADHQPQENV